MARTEWDLVSDANGNLGRTASTDRWMAPDPGGITVGDERLHMSREAFAGSRLVSGGRQMLERFADLYKRDDDAIAVFAGRWGLLDICTHGIAAGHPGTQVPVSLGLMGPLTFTYFLRADCVQDVSEPISVWRYWSLQCSALLSAASRLRDRRPPAPEDWHALFKMPPWAAYGASPSREAQQRIYEAQQISEERIRSGALGRDSEREVVAGAVSAWLHLANVGIAVRWEKRRPKIVVTAGGLLAGVALQLALAIGDADGWAVCTGCGKFHAPSRVPVPGRATYCETCRDSRVPERLASRAYRARKKERDSGSART